MHQASCGLIATDEALLGLNDLPRAERIAAFLLSLAVRLWCLPFLLLVWLTAWSAILLIRLASLIHVRGQARLSHASAGSLWRLSAGQDKIIL